MKVCILWNIRITTALDWKKLKPGFERGGICDTARKKVFLGFKDLNKM